ncbi:MAG: DUF3078 domain-containing protein [Lutibacter sp.]|uniref:DUF3078 domain-containing protein n=1 Tax=Lutibacter sp. TaxID=1925666 RepID=UPI00183FC29A|nr:DUF3078 domain-containing protein [Lutibacter sp.]MBT8318202.1 DUF3078 domain-containing protein [Lutibacter sp.]NNJ59062.1 DUF3078 domain-containing protein [Lutibacter sp.]
MKKITLLLIAILSCTLSFAQDNEEGPKDGWVKSGNISFLVNQSAFNNWIAGGQSNVTGTVGLNYDFNYKKGDLNWDNKLILAFGLTKIKGEDVQKSDDRIEWNSLIGKKASGNWFYSAFLNFKTQFADDLDSDTDGPTKFLSPGYLQFGPGMLWKKSDNLKINFAPATAKLVIVDKNLTLPNDAYFGVEEGKSTRFEFGAAIGAYAKFNLMPNVSMENILNLYSNYLEDPQNVDLDYTMNIVMAVNKYLSANLSFQTIYDDNAFEGFQTREVFGLGVNYGF